MTYDPEWGKQKKAELDEVRKQTAARVMAASAAGELRNPDKAEGGTDLFGLEERLGREFAASPALRDEFRTLERYIAYRKAEARGLVRILSKRREV